MCPHHRAANKQTNLRRFGQHPPKTIHSSPDHRHRRHIWPTEPENEIQGKRKRESSRSHTLQLFVHAPMQSATHCDNLALLVAETDIRCSQSTSEPLPSNVPRLVKALDGHVKVLEKRFQEDSSLAHLSLCGVKGGGG